MHENDHGRSFEGQPAKSADDIRRLLTFIHQANPPRSAGPYAAGLPDAERNAITEVSRLRQPESRQRKRQVRNRAYYRNLLLAKSTFIGGFSGGLLGFNIGVAAPIMAGWQVVIPLTAALGLLLGSATGIAMVRSNVVRRRADLFTRLT